MKAVAINTSPEKEWGAVSLLLDPYLEGLREAGADVELYYSRDLLIFPCCGNLNCTVRTPGQCMAYDDMRWLRQKIGQADVLVLASPQYFDGRTGEAGATDALKRLREQMIAARDLDGTPYEHAVHTTRASVNLSRVVIVTGCGFLEITGFYPVLTHLKAFCYNSFPELASCMAGYSEVKRRGALPAGVLDDEIGRIARTAGLELAHDCLAEARPVSPAACDGGTGPGAWRHREWGSEILFEFSFIK